MYLIGITIFYDQQSLPLHVNNYFFPYPKNFMITNYVNISSTIVITLLNHGPKELIFL